MSRRHPDAKPPYKQPEPGPGGRPRCRWCWGELPPRRRTFCGDLCVNEYRELHDWAWCRARALKRDRHICQMCGFDAQKMRRVLSCANATNYHWGVLGGWTGVVGQTQSSKRPLIEVDHIVPRYMGGTNALENLRTLCGDCHAEVTRQQAAQRAATKRDLAAALFAPQEHVYE